MKNLEKKLHLKFVKLGHDRRKLTNELLALLPEIFEKEIYKKYAGSIVEYAGKFGGLSKGVVLKRLRLEKHLKDKPLLREAIKTEGVHKVALVAKLATVQTEKIWIDKLENMSKAAVQELSKEVRRNAGSDRSDQSFCKAVGQKITIELDEEMTFEFLKLKKKLGKNLSNKEILRLLFDKANKFLSNKSPKMAQRTSTKTIPGDKISRYIPAKIKMTALQKTQGRCSYPGCNSPAEIMHHTDRFSISKNHGSIMPLCRVHHEFAHNGIIENENLAINRWQLKIENAPLGRVEQNYRDFRKHASMRP